MGRQSPALPNYTPSASAPKLVASVALTHTASYWRIPLRVNSFREVVHTTTSKTLRPREWEPSTTTSEQRTIEPAIMASEIERLPDLTGFLKLASIPDWMRVTLTHVSYPTVARGTRSASDQPGASAHGGADAPKRRG